MRAGFAKASAQLPIWAMLLVRGLAASSLLGGVGALWAKAAVGSFIAAAGWKPVLVG